MKVKVQLDRRYAEPEAAIYTAAMTGEVQQAVRMLSEESPQMLACCDGESVVLVEQTQLVRVYGAAKKVYAQTTQGEFLLRRRLYELEQILDQRYFVRISKSEIVNLRFVRRLDLSIAGTIGMQLKTGETAYVSRRYVNHIKSILEQGAFS